MNSKCFRCGQDFECGLLANKEPCWCAQLPSVKIEPSQPASCQCPNCLAEQTRYPTGELMTLTWRLWLAYDGTNYCGWQIQPGQKSIESVLKTALFELTGQEIALRVAGRTDAGVHARGQAVSCQIQSRFIEPKLVLALSSKLPKDISVWLADVMPSGFDAKRHSVGKRYVYRIHQALAADPFTYRISWHLKRVLNVDAMREAASYLVGEHDFESFRSANCQAEHARRYIWLVNVSRADDFNVHVDIRGNAFCHNMVRIIVGTLVEVGLGRMNPHMVDDILKSRDRNRAGRTAPAKGLTLERVYYPDFLDDAGIPAGARFPRYPVSKNTWPWHIGIS